MADPRKKVETRTFYTRIRIPQFAELEALAEKYDQSKNLVINELIKDAAKRLGITSDAT